MKVLISSVGSLVGQNIVDVLDFPGFSRRAYVEVVGTNSIPHAPSNFRCDRCHLVPETSAEDFAPRMQEILLAESPDIILCGRDEDTLALGQLKAEQPNLPGALPCPSLHASLVACDKWQTSLFSRRHGLPFADTFSSDGANNDEKELLAFCDRVGYPLVAKPARGFGSRGVVFIRDPAEARAVSQRRTTLFQEYLGNASVLESYFASIAGPPPLFARSGEEGHYSCQTVIDLEGRIAPVFIMYNEHEFGATLVNRRVTDQTPTSLTHAYARALFQEGATGPLNVQFRRDKHGTWKVQEINLRNTGSTFARFLLGFDELYLLVRALVPDAEFPELHPLTDDPMTQVSRRYRANPVADSAIAKFERNRCWP